MRPLLLAPLVLAASCSRLTSPTAVHIDPALAALVPADTNFIVGAKLEKLRQTPLYKTRFESVPLPQLDKFAKDTGLDPRKDVWDLLFCSNGKDNGVLMLRGKFSPTDLEPKLEREGATRTPYKGYNLFGDQRYAIYFMNMSTALAGSITTLKAIIDDRDKHSGGVPAALLPLVKRVPADSQFWAAFNGILVNMPFDERSNLGNINTMIRSLDNGFFAANLSKGLEFQALGNCKTDESAKQIHDALRGILGFVRLNTPDEHLDLLKAVDQIKVAQQQREVSIAADIPQATVDKVLDLFTSPGGGRRRR